MLTDEERLIAVGDALVLLVGELDKCEMDPMSRSLKPHDFNALGNALARGKAAIKRVWHDQGDAQDNPPPDSDPRISEYEHELAVYRQALRLQVSLNVADLLLERAREILAAGKTDDAPDQAQGG